MSFEAAPYDSAEFLTDEVAIATYVEEAFDTGDPAFIAKALGTVARARNMTKLAEDAGMSRTSLYKALNGQGRPEFATILRVLDALGLELTVRPQKGTA